MCPVNNRFDDSTQNKLSLLREKADRKGNFVRKILKSRKKWIFGFSPDWESFKFFRNKVSRLVDNLTFLSCASSNSSTVPRFPGATVLFLLTRIVPPVFSTTFCKPSAMSFACLPKSSSSVGSRGFTKRPITQCII